jgi:hypothetical protein
MRRLLSVLLAGFLTAGVAGTVFAQEKPAAKPAGKAAQKKTLPRFDGRIVSVNKDAKTLQVRNAQMTKTVVYSDTTKWTKRNAKLDAMPELKEGIRVFVLGDTDDQGRIVAQRIDLRE